MEREKLEREIYQLTQIIAANAYALVSKSTPVADRAGLQKQIDIRIVMWAALLKQLGDSSLGAAELRGVNAQAKAYPRSEAHEGHIASNPVSPARPH
jgi:cell division ATPase FtsA